MRIINIVDEVSAVNFGIWNAAIATSEYLFRDFNVLSEIWYPQTDFKANFSEYKGLTHRALPSTRQSYLLENIFPQLNAANDLIVTHGAWRFPTRWGATLKEKGLRWMYVPHGMLEPWSMDQKKWKKLVYFHLVESRLAKKADLVRAVGHPEFLNLKKFFTNVVHITNGVPDLKFPLQKKIAPPYICLFMARLHFKKGIVPLVEAWLQSNLKNNAQFKLVIAGPDNGELDKIKQLLQNNAAFNIEYVGTVHGRQKQKLLTESHFYFLPSLSEGFPTSVVEAMQYGLVPYISPGCNFPEAFQQDMAINIGTEKVDIIMALNVLSQNAEKVINMYSEKVSHFANSQYANSNVAALQMQHFRYLLS